MKIDDVAVSPTYTPFSSSFLSTTKFNTSPIYIHVLTLTRKVIVENKWFNYLIVFCILAAGVLVGVQSYPSMDSLLLDVADMFIQVYITNVCSV
jgi:hypothetical protein